MCLEGPHGIDTPWFWSSGLFQDVGVGLTPYLPHPSLRNQETQSQRLWASIWPVGISSGVGAPPMSRRCKVLSDMTWLVEQSRKESTIAWLLGHWYKDEGKLDAGTSQTVCLSLFPEWRVQVCTQCTRIHARGRAHTNTHTHTYIQTHKCKRKGLCDPDF